MQIRLRLFYLIIVVALFAPKYCSAEFKSSKDMAGECRLALDIISNHVEQSPASNLLAGECIGYIQAGVDASVVLAENAEWYKICIPATASTQAMVKKFIAFVDKYPQYKLAYTSLTLMLSDEYPCNSSKTQESPVRK